MAFTNDNGTDYYLTVGLPRETVEWLVEISHQSGTAPEVLIASMLDAIRADDQAIQHFH